MTIKHAETVDRYVGNHADIANALANLKEFVETMPAPDEQNHIPGLNYGHTGSVARIRELLAEASQIADEMFR